MVSLYLQNYNLKIWEGKTKALTISGGLLLWVKILINNAVIEEVSDIIYSDSHISLDENQKDKRKNLVINNRLNGILKDEILKRKWERKSKSDSMTLYNEIISWDYMICHHIAVLLYASDAGQNIRRTEIELMLYKWVLCNH